MADVGIYRRPAPDLDLAIVGAGLSGIGMAAHLRKRCPDLRFSIFERRSSLGGTWDLFRYPGIRSDSDMHTLGFGFEPWTEDEAIAGAPLILKYLNQIADDRDLRRLLQLETRVLAAKWDSAVASWELTLGHSHGKTTRTTARFLYLGSGYYDYDVPHDAQIPGRERFRGEIIHPQFWPEGLDYSDKRVVVIGSGATAVTLVPAMTDKAAHVTMLQRTPTWIGIMPSRDRIANLLQRILPLHIAYKLTRAKNVHLQDWLFRRLRRRPQRAKSYLSGKISEALGTLYRPEDFTPPYDPWDQRLCLVPNGDMFAAMRSGKASVVTDRIETIVEHGVRLSSGAHLPADVIVTATGLRMSIGGKIDFSIDGEPIDFAKRWFYNNCLISNLPNLALVFGYLNASWTLRVDLVADYLCRLFSEMGKRGADVVTPVMRAGDEPLEASLFEMTSGYIERGRNIMPRSAAKPPWRLGQDYLVDRKWMRSAVLDDGVLEYRRACTPGEERGSEKRSRAGSA